MNSKITIKKIESLIFDSEEQLLNLIFEEGIIKNIPILKTGKQIYDLVTIIKEQFFNQKLYNFIIQTGAISKEKKEEFIDKITKSGHNFKEIGKSILLLIEKLDSEEKATMIGKLFKACINEKISIDMYFRLSKAVDETYILDLKMIKQHRNAANLPKQTKEYLYSKGLLKIKIQNKSNNFVKNRRKKTRVENEELSNKFTPVSDTFYDYNNLSKLIQEFG